MPPSLFWLLDIFNHKIKLQLIDGNTQNLLAGFPPAARGVAKETHRVDSKAKTLINQAIWLLCCKFCDFLPEAKQLYKVTGSERQEQAGISCGWSRKSQSTTAKNSRGSTTGTLGPSSARAPSASCGRARRRRPRGSHAAAETRRENKTETIWCTSSLFLFFSFYI